MVYSEGRGSKAARREACPVSCGARRATRTGLLTDVAVPARRGEALLGERDLASILIRRRGDLAEREAVLAELLRRVDVKRRVLGLAGEFAEAESETANVLWDNVVLLLEEDDSAQRD